MVKCCTPHSATLCSVIGTTAYLNTHRGFHHIYCSPYGSGSNACNKGLCMIKTEDSPKAIITKKCSAVSCNF